MNQKELKNLAVAATLLFTLTYIIVVSIEFSSIMYLIESSCLLYTYNTYKNTCRHNPNKKFKLEKNFFPVLEYVYFLHLVTEDIIAAQALMLHGISVIKVVRVLGIEQFSLATQFTKPQQALRFESLVYNEDQFLSFFYRYDLKSQDQEERVKLAKLALQFESWYQLKALNLLGSRNADLALLFNDEDIKYLTNIFDGSRSIDQGECCNIDSIFAPEDQKDCLLYAEISTAGQETSLI